VQSLKFLGNQTIPFDETNKSNLVVPYNESYNFGTRDLTIEWWQKIDTDIGINARVFSVGNSDSGQGIIGVSIEYDGFVFTNNRIGQTYTTFLYPTNREALMKSWHHVAVVRYEGYLSIYLDGSALTISRVEGGTSLNDSTTNYDIGTTDICIGDMYNGNDVNYQCFKGLIDSFVWRVGVATYTENFQVPTSPPTLVSGTRLLLNGAEGGLYSTTGNTIINHNVETGVADNPYSLPLPYLFNKKGLLNQQSGSQIAARRRAGTLSTVQQNYMDNRIYNNKAAYAGTNDGYNAWHSLTRVRNLGATVPAKAQGGLGPLRVNTFSGQTATAGSATKDAKSSQTLDRNVPNEGRQNF
jgi:hypothetical protein